MATKALSKKKLLDIIKKLPSPVVQHQSRCKKLAEYFFEKGKTNEWLLTLNFNEKELTLAIASHDFGKLNVNPEFIHALHCKKESDKAEYRSHVQKGVEYIVENSDKYNVGAKGFDKYLYDCVSGHHENFDGSGFPMGRAGEEIPFVARLCAVVDYYDNLLNVGSVSEINIDKAIKGLKQASGTKLDPRICGIFLSDEQTLKSYSEDLFESDKKNRASKYGIALRFEGQYRADNGEYVGIDAKMLVSDPYFGYVPSKVFMPIASKTETVVQIDRILRFKALRQCELFVKHDLDFKRVSISQSLRTLSKKGYAKELQKYLRLYEVNAKNVTICVPEEFMLAEDPVAIATVQELHNMGVRISVDNFGETNSTFTTFETLAIDEIRLSPVLTGKLATSRPTYSIVEGFVKIAKNLNVEVVASEVEDEPNRKLLVQLGIDILQGKHLGGEKTSYAVEKELAELEARRRF